MNLGQIVGEAAAAKLRARYGGRSIRIPGWHAQAENSRANLAALIGQAATEALIMECGQTRIYVPMGVNPDHDRDTLAREIRRLSRRNWSASRIAEKLGCSERAIYRHRRIAKETTK
jgi:hypothetical protein